MSDGTKEARAAARWWANRLNGDMVHRTGDLGIDMFVDFARSKQEIPKTEQIELFKTSLEGRILSMVVDPYFAWEKAVEDDPKRGSALRAIGMDYHPDKILCDALGAAGLHERVSMLFPLRTVMWINPNEVIISLGGTSPVELRTEW